MNLSFFCDVVTYCNDVIRALLFLFKWLLKGKPFFMVLTSKNHIFYKRSKVLLSERINIVQALE